LSEKKNIFEKMGLVEKVKPSEQELNNVNELENIQKDAYFDTLTAKEKSIVIDEKTENIEQKLDVLIGAYEKNKFLSIEDIYRSANLDTDIKKTIFMADVYMKALPANLPIDVKRESVMNIMGATSISVEDILKDAYKRIDSLNKVLEDTVTTTEKINKKNNDTIKELENRIRDLKKMIEDRKKFELEQNTTIEYEIQRVINLVEFIKPKNK
jgi:hypothetical protein